MDFSRSGVTERVGVAFRAHVQWNDRGKQNAYGPRRPNEDAAQEDLESIRAAASGMGREEGFAAMAAEAKRLREGKPVTEGGCVKEIERSYRAVFRWEDERDVKGPRRAEKRRAVTGGPPLQAPIAMYPFGGFAQAPLSSCPYDEFLLSPLPCEPKALAGTPSLSAEGNF